MLEQTFRADSQLEFTSFKSVIFCHIHQLQWRIQDFFEGEGLKSKRGAFHRSGAPSEGRLVVNAWAPCEMCSVAWRGEAFSVVRIVGLICPGVSCRQDRGVCEVHGVL